MAGGSLPAKNYLAVCCLGSKFSSIHTSLGSRVSAMTDYTKARTTLGWKPRTSFRQLVRMMVDHDLQWVKMQASAT